MMKKTKKYPSKIAKLVKVLEKLKKEDQGEEKVSQIINQWQQETQTQIARAITVIPLTSEELNQIEKRLSLILNEPVLVINEINKNILGGLKIITGSKIIDSSLAHLLNQYQEKIKEFND